MLDVSFFSSSQINTISLIKRANDKLKKLFSFRETGQKSVHCHSASLNYGVFLMGWALYLTHRRPLL